MGGASLHVRVCVGGACEGVCGGACEGVWGCITACERVCGGACEGVCGGACEGVWGVHHCM